MPPRGRAKKRKASDATDDTPSPKRQSTASTSCALCKYRGSNDEALPKPLSSRKHVLNVYARLCDAVRSSSSDHVASLLDDAIASLPDATVLLMPLEDSFGLLHLATIRRNSVVFDVVLQRCKAVATAAVSADDLLGTAVNAADEYGHTALHFAAFLDMPGPLLALLQHRADPNAAECTGMTALHFAARLGQRHMIELLVEHKANIDALCKPGLFLKNGECDTTTELSALTLALLGNHEHAARRLLELGAKCSLQPVLHCARLGLTNMIRRVLGPFGAPMTGPYQNGESYTSTPLMEAVHAGHLETARALIEVKSDVNFVLGSNVTALSYSCQHPIELTRMLLEAGADPCASYRFSYKAHKDPLSLAMDKHDWDRARLLMQYGSDLRRLSSEVLASRDLQQIEFAIDHGATVPLDQSYLPRGALAFMMNRGTLYSSLSLSLSLSLSRSDEVIACLMVFRSGTEYHWSLDRHRFAPAIVKQAIETILLIRTAAAAVNSRTPHAIGWASNELLFEIFAYAWHGPSLERCLEPVENPSTFLLSAIEHNDITTAKILLRLGCSPNDRYRSHPYYYYHFRDDDEEKQEPTALHYAAMHSSCEMIQLLLDAKADTSLALDQRTPFDLALQRGDVEAAKLLLTRTTDRLSELSMCCLAEGGSMELLKVVVSHVANKATLSDLINPRRSSSTPLAIAASDGNTEMVRTLIELKADIHLRDSFNGSPLAQAVVNDNCETLRTLVELRGDIHVPIKLCGSLLHIAAAQGSCSTIRLLIDLGANKDFEVRERE